MKIASRMILAISLSCLSALANADSAVDETLLRQVAGTDEPSCASVKVNTPVKFRKRILVEIPDIPEPELKLANRLMSSGCFSRAVDQLQIVTKRNPNNFHAHYVVARMTWMKLGSSLAEQVLKQTLAVNRNFASAKVLLAGIRYEQGRLAEAATLFDEAERLSPTDMWVFMGRLRLESRRAPSEDLRVRLMEIVKNPLFPPNAREVAGGTAEPMSRDPKHYEELLRALLEVESNKGMACKAAKLAVFLSENQWRFADVITLLESPRAKQGNCLALNLNRTLLAQAYLMEALKISGTPTTANAHLLKRAYEVVQGDFVDVVAYTRSTGRYYEVKAFLEPYVQPDKKDAKGITRICRALRQLDVDTVKEELAIGAEPSQRCGDRSLVESVMVMPSGMGVEERHEIMVELLRSLATLTKANIDSCRNPGHGDCYQVLLPVMEEYKWLVDRPEPPKPR